MVQHYARIAEVAQDATQGGLMRSTLPWFCRLWANARICRSLAVLMTLEHWHAGRCVVVELATLADRQRECYSRPLTCFAFGPDTPTVRLDDAARNGQPQPTSCVLRIAHTTLVRTVKAIKDTRQIIAGNAGAGVADCDDDQLAFCFQSNLHSSILRRVPQCIPQEVREHLRDALTISANVRKQGRRIHAQRHALGGGFWPNEATTRLTSSAASMG